MNFPFKILQRKINGKSLIYLNKMSCSSDSKVLVKAEEVKDFCYRTMLAVNTKSKHSEKLANVLLAADYCGHFSHGLNRLEMYVNDVVSGTTSKENEPLVLNDSVSVALVDGKNCLGPVVGSYSMKLAIKKAKDTGVGWIAARGSNHFGIAGWYSQMACDRGLVGLAFTNSSPLAFPTRSKRIALGTNPISLAAPGKTKEDDFWLDMATTAVAVGKIEMKQRQKLPLPEGWAADSEGSVTTDADKGRHGGLLPLGGAEITSGYKGYGLAMLVEIFCGILSGSLYGSKIRKWGLTGDVANLGHGFAAINPEAFDPDFKTRMSDFATMLRNLPHTDPDLPVIIPGDKERIHRKKCDDIGGIPYPAVLIDSLDVLADRVQVKRLQRKSQ